MEEHKVCKTCGELKPLTKYKKAKRGDIVYTSLSCNQCRHTKSKKIQNIHSRIYNYKISDAKRGLDNNITIEWYNGFVQENSCVYCGETDNLGLDRLDNSKGHTIDNVVACCFVCNTARANNFTHEEMLELGKTIREIKLKRKML